MPFSRSRSIESMHALRDVLVLPERARLPEHRVDERRLAVVDVRDDRDVPDVLAGGHRGRVALTPGRAASPRPATASRRGPVLRVVPFDDHPGVVAEALVGRGAERVGEAGDELRARLLVHAEVEQLHTDQWHECLLLARSSGPMLSHMARVLRHTRRSRTPETVERRPLVPPERGSELALEALVLAPGASLDLHDLLHDTLLFVHEGAGALDDARLDGAGRCSSRRASRTLTAGPDGLAASAPRSGRRPTCTRRWARRAGGRARPRRARQGDGRALVPGPLRAAQRLHPRDAVRRLHPTGPGAVALPPLRRDRLDAERRGATPSRRRRRGARAGAAFRLRPREVHVVENVATATSWPCSASSRRPGAPPPHT